MTRILDPEEIDSMRNRLFIPMHPGSTTASELSEVFDGYAAMTAIIQRVYEAHAESIDGRHLQDDQHYDLPCPEELLEEFGIGVD